MPDSSTRAKRLGVSPWVWFERVSKVASFLIIPIALWAISVQVFISKGPRVTPTDLHILELELQSYVEMRIATLPPMAFREKVSDLEELVKDNGRRLQTVELSVAEIGRDMTAVLRILDSD